MVTTISVTLGFLLPHAAHLRRLGWRVDAAASGATTDPNAIGHFDALHDLPLSRSVLRADALVRGAIALSNVLEFPYDIVHVHTPIAGFLVRAAIRRRPPDIRPAAVYTAHGFHFHPHGDPVRNTLFRTAERLAGRWTDRLIVINEWDRDQVLEHHIVPARRLVYMPGIGVDTKRFARSQVDEQDAARVRADLGIATDAPLFVYAGELSQRKRPFDAVAALARMQHREAHLVLLGTGPLRHRVETLIRDLGLEDRAHLLGWVSDVRPAFRASSALVLASRQEGLPMCVMEALSLETPVITTDCRGGPDLVMPDAGLVVPIGRPDAMAAAMDAILDDPEAASEMGRRGHSRIVDHFDRAAITVAHEHIYRELLAERRGGAGGS